MNEPTEITELEDLLQECRSLYANLSERHAREVGPWPRTTEPIHLFPSEESFSEFDKSSLRRPSESLSGASDFGSTLLNLQKQFLHLWKKLLKANLDLENTTKDRAREQSELARLSEQVMLLSQSRAETAEEKSRIRRELEMVRVENREAKETIHSLEQRLAHRERELNALSSEMSEQERSRERAEEREKQLSSDIEKLESMKEDLTFRLGDLEKELESIRGRVDPLESDLSKSRERIAELESELENTLKERVSQEEHTGLADRLTVAEEARATLEHSHREIEQSKQEIEAALREKQTEIQDLKSEKKSLEKANIEARKVREALETQLQVQAARIEELEKASAEMASSEQIERIEQQLTSTLTDLESYREQFHRLERENATLKKALEEAKKTNPVDHTDLGEALLETNPPARPARSLSDAPRPVDVESIERERRIAEMESSEIESLEAPTEQSGSFVLSRENRGQETVDAETEDSPDPDSSLRNTGDPSFVTEVEEESVSQSTSEKVERPTLKFPYPEISQEGLEPYSGKQVLLVGGDFRFKEDYEHFFQLCNAEVAYFPSIIQLEKHGMKNTVREVNLVIAFGGAIQEPGLFRLRKVCSDYGRYLLENPSSGLVSLSQKMKSLAKEIQFEID
ncbi:MAG: hypothetical protein KC917_02525 [Candidatus Omnitrophica bacterium]|nr:hypothetical protein [Candidatus Omnitrophota bacterium]